MSLRTVTSTSLTSYCPRCKASTTTLYSALTLGDGDRVTTFSVTCGGCGDTLQYFLPNQRINVAQLALAEVFYLAASLASYAGTWTSADITTALGTRYKLSDFETVPFSVGENGGKIYYDSAIKEVSAATLLAHCTAGAILYGTAPEVATTIDRLTSDSDTRAVLRTVHGLAEK